MEAVGNAGGGAGGSSLGGDGGPGGARSKLDGSTGLSDSDGGGGGGGGAGYILLSSGFVDVGAILSPDATLLPTGS